MKTRKKITIGVIVAFLAVVMVGYIYLFTGAKIKNVSNDVIKGDEETKSLVAYFTRQGVIPGDVDAVSSATQSSNKGMEGSDTEGAARMIQSLTGADMYQIYTSHYYRRSFVGTAATAWIEERLNLRPELAAKLDNLDDYDTIYVGYPIWWFNAPMAIGSFLESYDLLGKTIIPFCTSQDNDISVSMDYIKAVASGANVLDGYRIHAADVDDVKEWLQRIGVLNENNTKDLNAEGNSKMETENSDKRYGSGIVPDELEYIPDGYEAPADQQGYGSDDFFIFAASGTSDFAYHAFKAQIMAMAQDSDGMFKFANNETDGNLSFLEREGYEHDQKACDEYTYNGLRFFWNAQ